MADEPTPAPPAAAPPAPLAAPAVMPAFATPQPPAAPAAPVQAQAQAQPPAPPPPPSTVTLSRGEYEKILGEQASLEAFRRQEADRANAAETARLSAVADKEGAEVALKQASEAAAEKLRQRDLENQTLKARYADAQKVSTLAGLVTSVAWASKEAGAAGLKALGDRFEAVEQPDGSIAVRERLTLRPADQAVPDLLKLAEFSFYQASGGAGGVPASGTARTPAPAQPQGEYVPPSNPGQEAFAHYLAQVQKQREAGYSPMGIPGLPGAARPGVIPAGATPAAPGAFDPFRRN